MSNHPDSERRRGAALHLDQDRVGALEPDIDDGILCEWARGVRLEFLNAKMPAQPRLAAAECQNQAKAISSKALTDISFPRSSVGMPFGPLQRPTMPEHRDGQGSHAGAWEPVRVIVISGNRLRSRRKPSPCPSDPQ